MEALQLVRDVNGFYYKKTELRAPNAELIIENIAAGVCGTDFEIARLERKDSACVLGHEGIGLVIKNFNCKNGFNEGDIIVYNPVSILDQDRILGHSIDGIFCNRRIISSTDLQHGHVLKIPSEYSPWYACLLEPLAVAIYSEQILLHHCRPQMILILGTGAIAHIIAAYYLRKKATVFMVGSNSSRLNSLIKNRKFQIQYHGLDCLLTSTHAFEVIFSCATRANASLYFEYAKKIATNNTIIHLINGFNDDIFVNTKSHENLSLTQVRRNNVSGHGNKVHNFVDHTKNLFLTGQRGANQHHFQQTFYELSQFPEHYQKLVTRCLEFSQLADLFNNKIPLECSHFGKILVKLKDGSL